jgi:hypothetical protein
MEEYINVFTIVKQLPFVNSITQLSWRIYLNGVCHKPNLGIIFMPEILYKLRDNEGLPLLEVLEYQKQCTCTLYS